MVKRRSLVGVAILVLAGLTGAAQQGPAFTVSSIKRNTSGLPYSQSRDRDDGVALVNERLRDIIEFAYGLYDFQLIAAPDWISRDRFDIAARADGPLSFDAKQVRVKQLLADRFGLRVHTETREQSVYALTKSTGKPGAGLTPRDCAAPGLANLACGQGLGSPNGGIFRMAGIPPARLAAFLGGVLGRVVQDDTGLTGVFDVDLQWRPDIGLSPDLTDAAIERINARPSLPVAIREQLGLELQPRRAPVQLVIVDAVSPPTPD